MATIGRSRAVAYLFHRIPLSGFIAWVAWLGLHLLTLMGFRNRLNVLVNWLWNYVTYDRSVRVILEPQPIGQAQAQAEFEPAEAPEPFE
jgi:NADH dehydrogenase